MQGEEYGPWQQKVGRSSTRVVPRNMQTELAHGPTGFMYICSTLHVALPRDHPFSTVHAVWLENAGQQRALAFQAWTTPQAPEDVCDLDRIALEK
eukprot:scaffold143946_cov19-Tisochrysis_lutea.AAC.4